MKSHNYLFSAVLAVIALLTACSRGPDTPPGTIVFSPSKGDVRSYQVHSQTRIRVGDSSRKRTMRMENDAVLRYQVLDTGATLKLGIEAPYTRFSLDGRKSFSSTNPDGKRGTTVLRELMSAGFEVDIDSDTGSIERFVNRNEDLWQTVLEEGPDPVVDNLKKQMSPPGFPQPAIPLNEGERITLPDFRGIGKLQLTTEQVTDDEVVTTLEAQGEKVRLRGTMVLERGNGWLKRLALVSETEIERHGIKGTSHQKLVMLPEGSPSSLGDWLLEVNLGGEEGRPFPPAPAPGELVDTATEEQVVPSPVGSFSTFDDQLRLSISHGFDNNNLSGDFELEDLELQDAAGNPLPLNLFRSSRYIYIDPATEQHHTMAQFIPLGWDNANEQLQKVQQITATGHYRPLVAEALTLPLNPEKATVVASRGARAEAIPTDNPREFRLRFHNTKAHRFSPRIHDLTDARGYVSDGDWLSAEEREMLRLVALGRYAAGDTRVVFEREMPETLTLYLLSETDSEPFDYQLRFVTEAALRNDLSLPPTGEVLLYGDETGNTAAGIELDELELPQPQRNQLSLELPGSLAEACKPVVVEAPQINGHQLVWLRQTAETTDDNRLSTTQHWQVGTEDGVRSYFYDIRVENAVRCKGQAKWQAVLGSLGDRPWLVDPTQLPGEIDPEQPIADFLRRYRFIGEQGRALAPVPPNSGVSLDASSVGDYLTHSGRLRLAGKVQRIEQLVFTGEPEERSWSASFQPLP
ncbi:hypothetical protein [Microbulbifer halophilus]|uniref:Lipoprotein n=1 Tax=Microbulbifer halophilus TaxID=453963 RepID=A0ABW5ED71_9GAMM|nr:hypothetical protein [Microbulbifer halophilus]MCW8127930.1 hypothetical protein [Microbulbifer halophilus]